MFKNKKYSNSQSGATKMDEEDEAHTRNEEKHSYWKENPEGFFYNEWCGSK